MGIPQIPQIEGSRIYHGLKDFTDFAAMRHQSAKSHNLRLNLRSAFSIREILQSVINP
jgi:hypothetical protein